MAIILLKELIVPHLAPFCCDSQVAAILNFIGFFKPTSSLLLYHTLNTMNIHFTAFLT